MRSPSVMHHMLALFEIDARKGEITFFDFYPKISGSKSFTEVLSDLYHFGLIDFGSKMEDFLVKTIQGKKVAAGEPPIFR